MYNGLIKSLSDDMYVGLPYEKGTDYCDYVLSYKTSRRLYDYKLDKHIDKNTKKIYFFPDPSVNLLPRYIDIISKYDILLVPYKCQKKLWEEELPDVEIKQWKQGVNLNLYNSNIQYNSKKSSQNWVFCGSLYEGRDEFGRTIDDAGNGTIFGNGWDPSFLTWGGVDIYSLSQAIQISSSVFSLNYNVFSNVEESFSVRIYKIMCSGGVLLTNKIKGFENIFTKGKHYLDYDSMEELSNYIKTPFEYFDSDYLNKISQNAQKEVLKKHTYEYRGHELRKILKL